jgi:hypothetical protein
MTLEQTEGEAKAFFDDFDDNSMDMPWSERKSKRRRKPEAKTV